MTFPDRKETECSLSRDSYFAHYDISVSNQETEIQKNCDLLKIDELSQPVFVVPLPCAIYSELGLS